MATSATMTTNDNPNVKMTAYQKAKARKAAEAIRNEVRRVQAENAAKYQAKKLQQRDELFASVGISFEDYRLSSRDSRVFSRFVVCTTEMDVFMVRGQVYSLVTCRAGFGGYYEIKTHPGKSVSDITSSLKDVGISFDPETGRRTFSK